MPVPRDDRGQYAGTWPGELDLLAILEDAASDIDPDRSLSAYLADILDCIDASGTGW